MADITFDDVVKLADQLSPEEQKALIDHLRVSRKRSKKRPSDTLLVFEVNAWPEGLTLRREDEYTDDGR